MSHYKNSKIIRVFVPIICLLVYAPITSANENVVVVIPLFGDEIPTSKIVFVTNGTYTGDLNGAAGADNKCQAEADMSGSKVIGKKFMAFLADVAPSSYAADQRVIPQHELPYKLVNGDEVAPNYIGFMSSTHSSPINVDQFGGVVTSIGDYVWANISPFDGTVGIDNCALWSSSMGTPTAGTTGDFRKSNTAWLDDGAVFCDSSHHLYCTER